MTAHDLIVAFVREATGRWPEVLIRRRPQEFMDELVIQDKRGGGYFVVLVLDMSLQPNELLLELGETARKYRVARAAYEIRGRWPSDALASDPA